MNKAIVTTSWDDGHLLDLKMADLLKKYAIKGTFYVSPNNREFAKNDLLSDEQVKLLSYEFEIGAHTMTHPLLNKISLEEAAKEISDSKKYLEQVIGRPIKSFCYPGGHYQKKHKQIIKQEGFKLARTVKSFCFAIQDYYEMPTSLHAYDHWLDVWNVLQFVNFNPIRFFKYYRHWDLLAMAMFDKIKSEGGIFHLWGHSWEIEKNNDWERLEKVFKYIGRDLKVVYATNQEL
jgi:peptidoglycan-N-acetylglucosamine deacetylase